MKDKNIKQIDDIREDPFEEYIKLGEPDKADKVSVHIAEILSDRSFVFSPAQYISIHRRLFQGVFSHAGKLRDYNIKKDEWVLDGASAMYGGALELRETLDYDFKTEQEFPCEGKLQGCEERRK